MWRGSQPLPLDLLRFLDLHDHLRAREHRVGVRHDSRAGLLVVGVVGEDAGARARTEQRRRGPCAVSSRTEPGTRPTRNSLLLISVGTPIRMMSSRSRIRWRENAVPAAQKVGNLGCQFYTVGV